jgi:hypothetical protein
LFAPVTTATVSLDHHLKPSHFQKCFRESTQLREHIQEKFETVNCRRKDHTLSTQYLWTFQSDKNAARTSQRKKGIPLKTITWRNNKIICKSASQIFQLTWRERVTP